MFLVALLSLDIVIHGSVTFCTENGRYWHAPIRSDTSIRVYATADTDTSTPCASVPVTYIIIPGRSFRERSAAILRNGWHSRLNMQTISNTPTCALSQFYDWSLRRNVSMIDS